MDEIKLAELLDADRETLLSDLARDRSPAAAQSALEKALDRVTYRFAERCADKRASAWAQHLLQTLKTAIPLVDAVSEARTWKKELSGADGKARPSRWAWILLFAGLLLVAATVLSLIFSGKRTADPLAWLEGLGPALAGSFCLWQSGRLWNGKKGGAAGDRPGDFRQEFLVDPERVFHALRNALVMADGRLEALREEEAVEALDLAPAAGSGPLPAPELDLLSELLELAYAQRELPQGQDAREMISDICFYLHNNGIDVIDFDGESAPWFETLPAKKPGTIRPALAAGGKLLKKGMASA